LRPDTSRTLAITRTFPPQPLSYESGPTISTDQERAHLSRPHFRSLQGLQSHPFRLHDFFSPGGKYPVEDKHFTPAGPAAQEKVRVSICFSPPFNSSLLFLDALRFYGGVTSSPFGGRQNVSLNLYVAAGAPPSEQRLGRIG